MRGCVLVYLPSRGTEGGRNGRRFLVRHRGGQVRDTEAERGMGEVMRPA